MSWPVKGAMMIEPTESEDINEMDRFIEAMTSIRKEIQSILDGKLPKDNNMIKNSPHTTEMLTDTWTNPYSKKEAVFPLKYLKDKKIWPSVSRIDNAYGDINLICNCPS